MTDMLQNAQISGNPDVVDPMAQLRILWRHKVEILSMVLLATLVAAVAVFAIRPTYRATSTLQIEAPKSTQVVKIEDVYEPSGIASDYQKTQYEVLRSRALATSVIEALDLYQHPEFKKFAEQKPWWHPSQILPALGRLLPFLPGLAPNQRGGADTDAAFRDRVVAEFQDRTTIQPVPNTNLVKINFEAKDPLLGAKVANELASAYIRRELQSRTGITEQASGVLGQRLGEVKQRLEESERALQQFFESQKLVTVGGTSRNLVESELTENAQRLRDAKKQKLELASVYQQIVAAKGNPDQLQDISQIQQQPLVHETKTAYLAAQEELNGLQSRYGPKHPKLVAAQARMQAARDAYYNQLRIRADGIRSEYEVAAKTESSLASEVAQTTGQIQQLDRKEYDRQVLEREVQSNRELYDTLLTKLKETGVTSEFDISIAKMVDPAVAPSSPYKPKKLVIVIATFIASFVLSVLLVFLIEFLDDTVKNTQELEILTGLPILGSLPLLSDMAGQAKKIARVEIDEPKSAFAEGMRTIRTSVVLADLDKKKKFLLVTSSIPGEGKTTIAENLALTMGQLERVLLIDADLRRPTLGNNLGIQTDSAGLTELVAGTAPLGSCVYRFEDGHIDIIPSGHLPPNPTELFSSLRFKQTLSVLAERYDRIIFDSAPCQAVSDTLLLARHADAVVFLTRSDSTPRKQVRNAVRSLRRAQAPLLGVILNQVDIRRAADFDGGYYYKYGYYG